jgi:hypothetical protein
MARKRETDLRVSPRHSEGRPCKKQPAQEIRERQGESIAR